MRKINEIILHCSATPEGRAYSIKDITRWHKERGFTTIGYHYVIHLDGSVHKGRNEAIGGAHCVGHNANSIGVCYIGGLAKDGKTPKDTRTPEQKNALARLVMELVCKYPEASVHGHNEFSEKACPCFNVKNEFTI